MSPREERFAAWKSRPGPSTLVALLEVTQGRVLAICRDVLQHPQEAEEAAQETLLKIVSAIDQVADAEHFERWVKTVASRTALDRLRMSQRRTARDLASASRPQLGTQPSDVLRDAIARLPDDERTIVLERYFERRTLDEMAQRRGLSNAGIRKRIEKAHERLKRMLGCGFPGGFWKGVGTVGATAMKTKAVAGLAVIVIPFLLLGGGVMIATSRRSDDKPPVAEPSTRPQAGNLPADRIMVTKLTAPPEPVRDPDAPLDLARHRIELVTCLERMSLVSRRAAECRRDWPNASTEEEGRQLQRDEIALKKEWAELNRRLYELAPKDPATIVDLVKNGHELPDRRSLAGLIAPEVNEEIGSEDGPSGPLLSGLMAMASGDAEDRLSFASFTGQLTRANRDLGRTLLNLMNDADHNVRMNASMSLFSLANAGTLRAFLVENTAVLQQISTLDRELSDDQVRGQALRVLASLGTEAADDFVLRRFEENQSKHDSTYSLQAVLMAGERIKVRHEARLAQAIVRASELPFSEHIYGGLCQMAYLLPNGKREEIMKILEPKRPDPKMYTGLSSYAVQSGQNRTPRRAMTGGHRMYFDGPRSMIPR